MVVPTPVISTWAPCRRVFICVALFLLSAAHGQVSYSQIEGNYTLETNTTAACVGKVRFTGNGKEIKFEEAFADDKACTEGSIQLQRLQKHPVYDTAKVKTPTGGGVVLGTWTGLTCPGIFDRWQPTQIFFHRFTKNNTQTIGKSKLTFVKGSQYFEYYDATRKNVCVYKLVTKPVPEETKTERGMRYYLWAIAGVAVAAIIITVVAVCICRMRHNKRVPPPSDWPDDAPPASAMA